VIVHPFTQINSMPDAGMLLGNMVPQHILDEFNSRYSGGVQFGGANDLFAQGYRVFNEAFVQVTNKTRELLNKARVLVNSLETFQYIRSVDDLVAVPPCMYEPILTYDPIREFHANDRIDGWGVDPESLPDNDPYEHVLNYGYMETDPVTGTLPDKVEWLWTTDDPDWNMQECDKLFESRRYIETFLYNEMKDGGQMRDPTGFVDGLLIGELR
jgi:hypothetical protein